MKQLKIAFILLSMIIFNLCEAATSFVGYFPPGCKLNNDAAGIVGTCVCIKDSTTKDVWLATSSEGGMSWDGSAGTPLGANGWVKSFNNPYSGICGITGGWRLPTKTQLGTLAGHSSDWFGNNGFVDIDVNGYYFGAEVSRYKASYLSINDGTVNQMLTTYADPHMHAFAVHPYSN